MTDAQASDRQPLRLVLAIAAIALGLGLLAAAGLVWARYANQPAAYHYGIGEIVPSTDLGSWSALAKEGITVRAASVSATDGAQLAKLKVAETKTGPVLIDWQPSVDPPFLNAPPPASDVTALAPVLGRHVAKGETVLAWWDTSRQLALLTPANYAFPAHLGVPLFVSPAWSRQRQQIDKVEAGFWKSGADADRQARFQRFVHALLADPATGLAELRDLAGPRKAVLVLHARDMLLLGKLAPEKVGVAIRDFPDTGDVHSMVPIVKDWLRRNHYQAYTVVHHDDSHSIRAIALTDKASGHTLAARLLPFVGNDQSSVPGTVLVYKTGGFWVYEIEPAAQQVARNDDHRESTGL